MEKKYVFPSVVHMKVYYFWESFLNCSDRPGVLGWSLAYIAVLGCIRKTASYFVWCYVLLLADMLHAKQSHQRYSYAANYAHSLHCSYESWLWSRYARGLYSG